MAAVGPASAEGPKSYKAKLLAPSDQDELSHPDQTETLPKLPPTKDEGSPPMTIQQDVAKAPAGADEAISKAPSSKEAPATEQAPTSDAVGNTQTAIDARHKFGHFGPGRNSSVKQDFPDLPEGIEAVPQPQHVDDKDIGGSDDRPSPDATGPGDTAGNSTEAEQINIADVANTKVAGTTLSSVEQQVISDPTTNDLLAAATADEPVRTEPPKANVAVGATTDTGDVEGFAEEELPAALPYGKPGAAVPVVPEDTSGDDTDRNAPAKALGMEVAHDDSDYPAAAEVAKEELPEAGGDVPIITASDAAAAGLAQLENEADTASPPAAAPQGDSSRSSDAAPPQHYAALAQAPGAEGDAAAVPAASEDDSSSGSDAAAAAPPAAGPVKAPDSIPEPAVGTEKEGNIMSDTAAEGSGDIAGSADAPAAEQQESSGEGSSDDNSGAGLSNPIAAVGEKLAGAVGTLTEVLLGHDVAEDIGVSSDAPAGDPADSSKVKAEGHQDTL